ncbi:MAG: hypothetical protein H7288_00370 [Kineosporiaceae bacterium]|nr:hypothetical protein [Aeromicrobium sp.]
MSGPYAIQDLSTVRRVGVLGDLHGDLLHLRELSYEMRERGISVLVSTGDLGLVDARPEHSNVRWASEILASQGQTLLFVDGNLDHHADIYEHPVDRTGYRWVASNLAHLPRGFRTKVAGGRTLAALGGAASVDRPRTRFLETVNADDLLALGTAPVDVLIGHDAPAPWPALDAQLETIGSWTADALAYAAEGRHMFTHGFLAVQPKLYIGSHFHLHLDETLSFGDGDEQFTSRVVLLDAASHHAGLSQGVLELASLDFEPFSLDSGTWLR